MGIFFGGTRRGSQKDHIAGIRCATVWFDGIVEYELWYSVGEG